MILLSSTSDLLRVTTSSAATVKVHASYVDRSGATITPGRQNTNIASATTTTIVDSPVASTDRTVKFVSIFNDDASTAVVITVNHTDGATSSDMYAITLAAQQGVIYDEGNGWSPTVVASSGGSGITDGDKGDITVAASGLVWTIDNGVVTLAKQADMATASVVYRKTAGTGAPEVQTLATLKTDLGLTGTNSGDQTSIVGITGTKAQFDTAVTDGNILYVGDVVGVSDGDKGDITVSASGATWTIDAGSVTLAKQADMATASVVYRKTAGTGAPEVQTLATLKTDLGLTGTNSGDQTTIVGITGTKTEFNTAVTGGDFVFSDTTGVTGADAIINIISLTAAEYAAIGTKDAATLYIVT